MLTSLIRTPSGIGLLGMAVAVATVTVAIAYAYRPNERQLAMIRPLSLATIFAALCSFAVGIATVLEGLGNTRPPVGWNDVALGASEAFVPLFAAFGCLTIAWISVAIGMRRTS